MLNITHALRCSLTIKYKLSRVQEKKMFFNWKANLKVNSQSNQHNTCVASKLVFLSKSQNYNLKILKIKFIEKMLTKIQILVFQADFSTKIVSISYDSLTTIWHKNWKRTKVCLLLGFIVRGGFGSDVCMCVWDESAVSRFLIAGLPTTSLMSYLNLKFWLASKNIERALR